MGQPAIALPAGSSDLRSFMKGSLVWDNHTALTMRTGRPDALAQLERHRAAGVDVVGINVGFDAAPPEDVLVMLAEFRAWLKQRDGDYMLAGTAADIEAAHRQGKLAVFFNVEGGNALQGRLSFVSLFHDLGVRWMLFAYNKTNALAGGCQDVDEGLTDFGRSVLEEMERVGMLVCCSHIGERSALEVMSRATRPVIYSHSNPAAMWPHSRNISDRAMKSCAQLGGVVGINGIGIFLGDNDARADTMVRHIDYALDLIGPDHVSIGLDYAFDAEEVQDFVKAHPETYPPSKYPNGIEMLAPEAFPHIAALLLDRGWSPEEVRKVLGGNLLRVARQVWR